MSIFHLEILEHGRQFGETASAERLVIAAILQSAAQRVGAGHPIGGADNPEPLSVNGVKVGRYWIGADSHRAKQGRA